MTKKGWDYHVGSDLTTGIEKAVAERNANERIARQLKAALNEKLAKAEQVLKSEAEKQIAKQTTMTDWKELNLPSAKELLKTLELPESPALINRANNHQEALELLRNELGVKAGEQKTISTPVGDILINESWLSHIVEKRDAERERYVKLIMPTLKEPTEVWLADYGNDDFRKRYIKLFSTGSKQMLVVISILNDSAIWNMIPMPVRSLDNQRNGELLLKNY